MTGCNSLSTQSAPVAPISVTAKEMAVCPDLAAPASKENEHVVPAFVAAVEAYNECAASKESLVAKVIEHNNKAEKKNKNETATAVGTAGSP